MQEESRKMKILFVITNLRRGGAERMLVNISNELVRKPNFEVAIYLVNQGNEFEDILDPRVGIYGGAISFRFSLYRKNKVDNDDYINFINDFKPNIIHSHLFFAELLTHSYYYPEAFYFSHQHNSEVQVYNGISLNKLLNKRMWSDFYEFSWLKNKFKKHQTTFIACSAGTLEMIDKKIGFGKIITLPNAVPLPEIDYSHKTLNSDCISLIWVGSLTNVKRPQLALNIAKELKGKGLIFKLKIVGDGINSEECSNLIEKHQLEDYVEMMGLVNKMNTIYLPANLMIHTAVYEGLPMVFIEANSYGVPIVSSDCMPNNEFLESGKNGIIVSSENPKDFADSIEKIISDKHLYEKLSEQSIENAKEFGIEKYVERLIDIYNNEV
ncbi:MAG: glycosyltransferase [Bacteroidota bacterium]